MVIAGVRSQKPNRLLGQALLESLLSWEDTRYQGNVLNSLGHIPTPGPDARRAISRSLKERTRKRVDVTVLIPTQTVCYTKE